jgi:hypothetical protein
MPSDLVLTIRHEEIMTSQYRPIEQSTTVTFRLNDDQKVEELIENVLTSPRFWVPKQRSHVAQSTFSEVKGLNFFVSSFLRLQKFLSQHGHSSGSVYLPLG